MSFDFQAMQARQPNAPAVVLLSGGLDSATVLAIAKKLGYAPYALSFRYGQRHSSELDAAVRVAQSLGAIRHEIIDLDLRRFVGGSALTDDAYAVPTSPGPQDEIPITYVPARNTIMLSVALGWAEALGGLDIFFGANAVDYSGYPDCRPDYVKSFEATANLATKVGVESHDEVIKKVEAVLPDAYKALEAYKTTNIAGKLIIGLVLGVPALATFVAGILYLTHLGDIGGK